MSGSAFRQGYDEQSKRSYIEQTREQKLSQLQLQTERSQLQNNRLASDNQYIQDQRDYEAEQRELQLRQLKQLRSQVASTNIDQAVLGAGKGDYSKLRQILLNGTEGNPNKEIKDLVEQQLGGKVIDVREPTQDDVVEGEEILPDQVAIKILTDAGEEEVHLMSNRQLGIMTGVPRRVGVKTFNDHMDGKYRSQAVDNALKLSVGFDGQIKNLRENLIVASAIGNDPSATKLLGILGETTAKDGESLLQALTTEYAKANPEDKPQILKKIKEVSKLMNAINKRSDKQQKPVEQLQQELVEAYKQGDMAKVEEITNILDKLNTKGVKQPSVSERKYLEEKQASETLHSITPIDIEQGKVDSLKYSDLLTKAIGNKTTAQRQALARNEFVRLHRQSDALDLNRPELRTGRVDEKGKRLLEAYRAIEIASGAKASDSVNKKIIEGMQATKSIMANASEVVSAYDQAKRQGLFTGTNSLGVMKAATNTAFKFLGDLFLTGDEEHDNKAKARALSGIHDTVSNMDRFDELSHKKNLTSQEKDELDRLKNVLQIDDVRKWNTQTYLVLKKLLQSISGQGVTNQELEAFKKAFSGQDFDSLDSVMAQLKASAFGQLNLTNATYNDLVNNGMPYTATKNILDIRRAGAYLINSDPRQDVSQGLSSEVALRPTLPPKLYEETTKRVASRLGMTPAYVKEIVNNLLDYQATGGSKSVKDVYGLSKSEVQDYLTVAEEMNKAEELYNQALKQYKGSTPPKR